MDMFLRGSPGHFRAHGLFTAQLYGVATFYSQFICSVAVCTSLTSAMVRLAMSRVHRDSLTTLEEELGIKRVRRALTIA